MAQRPDATRPRSLFIACLQRSVENYSLRRFQEAAFARGHILVQLNPLNCNLVLSGGAPRVFHERKGYLEGLDAVLVRRGSGITDEELALIDHLEGAGFLTVNSHASIARARDKILASRLLATHGIPVPKTVLIKTRAGLEEAFRLIGRPPFILKPTRGTHGVGVMLAESRTSAESIFDAFGVNSEGLLIQEFIREARGTDLRVVVVDGRVVSAMRRRAPRGEFRANIHRQGVGERVRLSPRARDLAVRSAQVAGLEVAGVDLIESRRGPLVVELNTSPGFEGLERATGDDVAAAIIAHVEKRALAARQAPPGRHAPPFAEIAEDWPWGGGGGEEREV
ncbi:MAG TPA: RimK family alpha-L-glutamate ligase [Candidatus Thermoplasmatota archaeon]|nr:RimK family alpha-L-glutamate ligase [Candidatus Thermoplasmatota archaeon]